MQAVTITQITPPELEALIENSIKRVLNLQKAETQTDPDSWFDLQELRNYLPDKPATATVYGWVHAGMIPYHKGGKRLRFRKSEIDGWLMMGGKKTKEEIVQQAHTYLLKSKSGGIK